MIAPRPTAIPMTFLLAPVVLALGSSVVTAQEASSSRSNEPASQAVFDEAADDQDHIRKLLGDVRDHVYSFDHPAFYRIREQVATDGDLAKYRIDASATPIPWRFMLERPSDYRGSLVLVEGLLLSKTSYQVPNRSDQGLFHECHLGQADTRAVCTVVLTEDPVDIPVNSTVRTKGYFILARTFENKGGQSGSGPLLVARRLERHGPPAVSGELQSDASLLRWAVGATAMLAIIWLALRRVSRRTSFGRGVPHRPHAPGGESQRDFDWLLDDSGRDDPEGR